MATWSWRYEVTLGAARADRWTEPVNPLRRLQAGPGVTRLPPASGSLPLPPGLSNKCSLPQ